MTKFPTSLVASACAAVAGLSFLMSGPAHAAPTEQGSGAGYQRLQSLEAQAEAALKSGDAPTATRLASQLLRENTDRSSWNYGNVVYDANQTLGLAALRQGDVAGAKRFLRAAGRTPGSPQLDSFGPEMTLAQALWAHGERQAISDFLDDVAKFWATPAPGTQARFLSLYADHAATIKRWKAQIVAGQKPSLDRFASSGDAAPTSQAAPPEPALLAAGAAAPDFTVQDPGGKPLKLSDYRGKVVVLDFWSTWCGPCQASLPHTNEVAQKFKDKNVVVLAVNVWDTQDAFDKWLPAHKQFDAISFAIDPTKDQEQGVATKLYHVSGIPTQYVIGPDGKVVQAFVGFGGPTSDLSDAITKALPK